MGIEFAEKYHHLVSERANPGIPYEVVELRKKLIMEELQELLLGIAGEDIVAIADGISDLVYVLVGTAISYGIPFERCYREVHASNMTKIYSPKTHGEKYGSVDPKGPGFIPADILGILAKPEEKTELEKLS